MKGVVVLPRLTRPTGGHTMIEHTGPPTRPEEFVEPRWARFLFASTTAAWIWLVIRLYIVTVYLPAGWSKVTSGKWLFGDGSPIQGLVNGVIFLNGNFVLAGALGSNPVLITLGALLVVAWRNAGWIGLDRWLLPIAQRPSVPPPVAASFEAS